MSEPNRIPAAPIVKVVLGYLDGEGSRSSDGTFDSGSSYLLAERADVRGDTLEKIISGRAKTIDFDLADRLLCVMNMTDLWQTELSEVYEAVELVEQKRHHPVASATGMKVCERRGCSERFLPSKHRPGQRFCSNGCRTTHWSQEKRGVKTKLRGKGRALEALVCVNGHERTSENTGHNWKGARYCKECNREAKRRSYRAHLALD